MSLFYDFGRFNEITEEKIKADKELFLRLLANMCYFLEFPHNLDVIENEEVYLNILLRKGKNILRIVKIVYLVK